MASIHSTWENATSRAFAPGGASSLIIAIDTGRSAPMLNPTMIVAT